MREGADMQLDLVGMGFHRPGGRNLGARSQKVSKKVLVLKRGKRSYRARNPENFKVAKK